MGADAGTSHNYATFSLTFPAVGGYNMPIHVDHCKGAAMDDEVHYGQLIETNKKALRILEKQRATLGIATPPHIILQIEYYEEEISKYQEKLHTAAGQLSSQAVSASHQAARAFRDVKRRLAAKRKHNTTERKHAHPPSS